MTWPSFPAALAAARWEREAGTAAAARPVGDALRAAQRAAAAVDEKLFDASGCKDLSALTAARTRMDAEAERKVRPACTAARAVAQAVSRWEGAQGTQGRRNAAQQKARSAASEASSAAEDYARSIETAVQQARTAFDARKQELEAARARPTPPKAPSPESLRLKAWARDRLRTVKMRPDVTIRYLLCVSNTRAAAMIAPNASESNKPLLKKALQGDTGLKFYKGEMKWEEGSYTFVGPRMTQTIARRVEQWLKQMNLGTYRIKAHE